MAKEAGLSVATPLSTTLLSAGPRYFGHAAHELIGINRLVEEMQCAIFNGFGSRDVVVVRGNENDWKATLLPLEHCLQFKAAQSGKPLIENKTLDLALAVRGDEFLSGSESPHPVPIG